MKNTLLFPDKSSMDAALEGVPFEEKIIAMEEQNGENWLSTFVENPIVYNTVDLGLPSGLLWSDKNIGAASPDEPGLYFQWGDISGYTAEQVGTNEGQKEFSYAYTDYKFGVLPNFTKYNSSDGKTVLDTDDDAAHVLMGGSWRLPTIEEFYELVTNTDMFLVPTDGEEIAATISQDGQGTGYTEFTFATYAENCTGMKFYKKGDHSKFIFVPSSGVARAGSVLDSGFLGRLWTSSLLPSQVDQAWYFGFSAHEGFGDINVDRRCDGLPLRGVYLY